MLLILGNYDKIIVGYRLCTSKVKYEFVNRKNQTIASYTKIFFGNARETFA